MSLVEIKQAISKEKRQSSLNLSATTQPNTYTVLQNLKASKIIDNASEEKQIKILSSSKVGDISKSYSSFVEENLLNTSKDHQKKNSSSKQPSCSRIIEESPQEDKEKDKVVAEQENNEKHLIKTKVSKSKENIPSTKSRSSQIVEDSPEKEEKEKEVVAKQVFRRRSQRTSSRRSTIDFEVAQKFRKQKQSSTETVKMKETATSQVPEEFSLTDNQPLDLNVSFVHDEEEGLVCASQSTGTVFKLEDYEMTSNGVVVSSTSPSREAEEEEQIVRELDSGISDSEDVNAEEKLLPQPAQPRKASTMSSKNRSFTQHKGKKRETYMNRSTVSNQSLNRSSTSKKVPFPHFYYVILIFHKSKTFKLQCHWTFFRGNCSIACASEKTLVAHV